MGAAACGGGEESSGEAAPSGAASGGSNLKVGLAYDVGGRGDQSFNDAAAAGLDKAKAELNLAEARELSAGPGETDAQKEERLRLLASSGYNPIIAVGFAYSGALGKVAKEFPDVKFAIVDDAVEGSNITNLLFAEHEGSFLVGAAAALKSEKNNIGFIGGVRTPLIEKFQAGYEAGAKSVKPDIKIQSDYLTDPPDFNGFNDPARARPPPRACTTPARTSSTRPRAAPAAACSRPRRPRTRGRSASTPTRRRPPTRACGT